MTIKVYIDPYANDGILRVIEAQMEHLPKFGAQIAKHPSEADVICNHGTALIEHPNVPSVHVGHGLYWSRQPWGHDFEQVNEMVVEVMRHSVAHTAPSDWVNRAIRRGGYWYPETVYHGVDAHKFKVSKENGGYILWNKARADFVSDPRDVTNIAARMQNRMFWSTIGHATHNLKVFGAVPHARMREIVANASVYLATARETFGIGTLEALACGIPVAGWDWGGQSEIIVQGETGYLAPPGDYRALAECIDKCISERDRLSANARADAETRWKWEPRIEQYANIFKRVVKNHTSTSPKVSVIVTAYKLDQFLPDCLNSISRQTYKDFECLVIDDASLDSTRRIVETHAKKDKRFRYIPTPNNFGLPGARNFGLSKANGKYIRHVDADDLLAENCLAIETKSLDENNGIDIVYGHLETVRTDGSRVMDGTEPVRSGWPEPEFKWNYQMAHLNQIPSCAMARRDVYVRSGGYRERMTRNEDAEFWCRVTSLGFRAQKVTEAVTYFHRERHDSKGAVEWQTLGAEPDWTAWFPWRWGGHNFESGWKAIRDRGDKPRNIHLVPFGAQGKPPAPQKFWYVHDYAYPVVSIIVTVGPGHRHYLLDALDSIQAQTYPDWECIVVNDTGEPWNKDVMGAPWAKVVNMDGNRGASAARNEGLKHIHKSSRFVVWMDADDYWLPWFLEKMVAYAHSNEGVIFSDVILQKAPKEFEIYKYNDFQSERVPQVMQYAGSSVLYHRKIVEAMVEYQGGFDEQIPGTEDWLYQIGVHHLGFCAYRIPEPLFVYRMYSTTKREKDLAVFSRTAEYVDGKYPQYRKGEKQLMCGCSKPKTPNFPPSSLLSSSGNFDNTAQVVDPSAPQQMVTMEYTGPNQQTFTINSRVMKGVSYRFGNNDLHRTRSVLIGDVDFLLSQNVRGVSVFRVVSNIAAQEANDPAAYIGQPIS